jgi:hypothetical protein
MLCLYAVYNRQISKKISNKICHSVLGIIASSYEYVSSTTLKENVEIHRGKVHFISLSPFPSFLPTMPFKIISLYFFLCKTMESRLWPSDCTFSSTFQPHMWVREDIKSRRLSRGKWKYTINIILFLHSSNRKFRVGLYLVMYVVKDIMYVLFTVRHFTVLGTAGIVNVAVIGQTCFSFNSSSHY